MPILANRDIQLVTFFLFQEKSAIKHVTNNVLLLAHEICHTCNCSLENLPQT